MRLVGVGYRPQLAAWIRSRPAAVRCLEITAEHFFGASRAELARLRADYPLFVHGLGLSLGTPGPLDAGYLKNFATVCRLANPEWISEHIAFTRTAELDLGHLNPVRCSVESLSVLVEHAQELMALCGRELILENITSHLRLPASLSEVEFINRLCEQAGCGLLLDVTNLYINSFNHGFDARTWLHDLEPDYIVQLHVVGYGQGRGRLEDRHDQAIQQEIMALLDEVLAYAPVKAITIERDDNFPPVAELESELRALERALVRH